MRITVVGLGYVGAVTSACLADAGHDVLGIDVDPIKLELLGQGKAPIVEEEISDITRKAVESGRLRVQADVNAEAMRADIVFVCVGTPSAENGSQDLGAVERVAEQMGDALSNSEHFCTIVMRSTVPPGTTEGLVRATLEQHSGKREGHDFGLCFQPEFLREGSSVRDFHQPPFTVVGGAGRAAEQVRELFGGLSGDFIVTDVASAEMLKVVCNAFHALKVSFANEIGRLGKALDVDSRVVMRLMCRDTQLNISPAYLRPGFAFGGSCLPKDLRALLHLARTLDTDLPMLQGVLPSNQLHIEAAAKLVRQGSTRNVVLLGLSFKQGTDDLRESPLVALAEHLIGKGYELRIHDPSVSLAMLVGANRRYIDQTIPHLGTLLEPDLDAALSHGGTLVVGHQNPEIIRAIKRNAQRFERLVDLTGVDAVRECGVTYSGIAW